MTKRQISFGKKVSFSVIMLCITFSIVFAFGEVLVRVVSPTPSLSPRFEFSNEYGFDVYKNTVMVHEKPGHWRLEYTVNEKGTRGEVTPISNCYPYKNILILGDSYSFGMGVNDGEEYASLLNEKLSDEYNVVNLSVPGWGLTQQIKRYYNEGKLYNPTIVILQFTHNDLKDNILNAVTSIQNGRFIFSRSTNKLNFVKKYLSNSILQKSQLYNYFRGRLFKYFSGKIIEDAERHEIAEKTAAFNYYASNGSQSNVNFEQKTYLDLLNLFAKDLRISGIELLFLPVHDHLERFDYLSKSIKALESDGYLQIIDSRNSLGNPDLYWAPDGHRWNNKAHAIIANILAEHIVAAQPNNKRSSYNCLDLGSMHTL